MARYDTAQTILQDVAVECGLASVADPYASTDANYVLLRLALKRAGRALILERDWPQLHREATITVGPGDTGVYDLPADFHAMLDQTGWDHGTEWPLAGPISPQGWQYLQAVSTAPIRVGYRLAQDQIWLHPSALAEGKEIRFEYRSRYWVRSSGETEPDKDAPTANTDTVLYEPELITRLAKVKFLEVRGFDTTAALADYRRVLQLAAEAEPAPVLRCGGGSRGEKFIGEDNVPDTGYGS